MSSLWMSALIRASNEGLMSPAEITGNKEFMQAALMSMAFSSGGNTTVRPTETTGTTLPSTTSGLHGVEKPTLPRYVATIACAIG